jgi:hypothetical protein
MVVKPVNNEEKRCSKGFHLIYFHELMETDRKEFFGWTRMWPHEFRNLYELVRPRLLKRSRCRSLHPEAGFDPVVSIGYFMPFIYILLLIQYVSLMCILFYFYFDQVPSSWGQHVFKKG